MFLGIWFVNTWVNSVYFIRIIYRFLNVMTRYINMYVRDAKFYNICICSYYMGNVCETSELFNINFCPFIYNINSNIFPSIKAFSFSKHKKKRGARKHQ